MDRADARAREHRDRQLGNQRQVDRDAVAALDAERLQHVRELTDLAVEIAVGQRAAVAWLAFPDDRRLVAARSANVPIDAVDAGVERAADEPLRVRRLPLEHARPRREPLELLGEAGPEGLRIALGAGVDVLVAHVACARNDADGANVRSSWSRSAISGGAFGSAIGDQDTCGGSWHCGGSGGGSAVRRAPAGRRCGRTPRRARRRAWRRWRRRRASRQSRRPGRSRDWRRAIRASPAPPAACRARCARSRRRAAPGAAPSRMFSTIETISQTTAPMHSGQKAGERAAPDGDRSRIVLLIEIRAEHAAADHPQAAAGIAQVDDRQRRQHADEEAAENGRLANRSTPARDA